MTTPILEKIQRAEREARATGFPLNLQKRFDPNQPRDDHGRWSEVPGIGAATGPSIAGALGGEPEQLARLLYGDANVDRAMTAVSSRVSSVAQVMTDRYGEGNWSGRIVVEENKETAAGVVAHYDTETRDIYVPWRTIDAIAATGGKPNEDINFTLAHEVVHSFQNVDVEDESARPLLEGIANLVTRDVLASMGEQVPSHALDYSQEEEAARSLGRDPGDLLRTPVSELRRPQPIPDPQGYPSPHGPVHGLAYHGGYQGDEPDVFFLTSNRGASVWYAIEHGDELTTYDLRMKNPANERDLADVVSDLGIAPESIATNSPYTAADENPNDYIYVPEVRDELARRGFDGLRAWDVMLNYEIQIFVPFDHAEALEVWNIEDASDLSEISTKAFDPNQPRDPHTGEWTAIAESGWDAFAQRSRDAYDAAPERMQAAVDAYVSGGYEYINESLRGEGIEALIPSDREDVKQLDAWTRKQTFSEPTVLYRSGGIGGGNDIERTEGSTFTEPAFTSTSIAKYSAEGFGRGFMWEIRVPAGQHYGFGAPGENEVILPRNTEYRIDSVRTDEDGNRRIVATVLGVPKKAFDPAQLRDEHGRWTDSGLELTSNIGVVEGRGPGGVFQEFVPTPAERRQVIATSRSGETLHVGDHVLLRDGRIGQIRDSYDEFLWIGFTDTDELRTVAADTVERLERKAFDPDQPRDPHTGEWTDTDTVGDAVATTPNAWYQSLTEDEFKAGEFYKGTGYRSMNPALRGHKELSPLMQKRVQLIDSALAKGALAKDQTLYRMAPAAALGDLQEGQEIVDESFISTSMKRNFAGDYRHHKKTQVFEIRAKAGQRGGYADQLWRTGKEHLFVNPNLKENEFILPRGTRFRVTRVWAGNDGLKHVQLEVVE